MSQAVKLSEIMQKHVDENGEIKLNAADAALVINIMKTVEERLVIAEDRVLIIEKCMVPIYPGVKK